MDDKIEPGAEGQPTDDTPQRPSLRLLAKTYRHTYTRAGIQGPYIPKTGPLLRIVPPFDREVFERRTIPAYIRRAKKENDPPR